MKIQKKRRKLISSHLLQLVIKSKKISSTSKIKCEEVTPLAVSGGSTVYKKVNGWI